MNDNRQLSHDILNILERLRIMHDLVKDRNFEAIPKEEIEKDLQEALSELKTCFTKMLQ